MITTKDVTQLVAAAVGAQLVADPDASWFPPPNCQWGLDDTNFFIRSGPKVFRIMVEEISQISSDDQAEDFMSTLPFPPE